MQMINQLIDHDKSKPYKITKHLYGSHENKQRIQTDEWQAVHWTLGHWSGTHYTLYSNPATNQRPAWSKWREYTFKLKVHL